MQYRCVVNFREICTVRSHKPSKSFINSVAKVTDKAGSTVVDKNPGLATKKHLILTPTYIISLILTEYAEQSGKNTLVHPEYSNCDLILLNNVRTRN